MQEIELKFLDIDKEAMHEKLLAIGAEKKYKHKLRSIAFSSHGYSTRAEGTSQFLRVRQIGDTVILTHKGPNTSKQFKSRVETEITTQDSFEDTVAFFEALGYSPEQESNKYRTHYERGKAHFEIDEWKGLPPFLEIETQSEEEMKSVCTELGLDISQGSNKTVTYIYPEHFGY